VLATKMWAVRGRGQLKYDLFFDRTRAESQTARGHHTQKNAAKGALSRLYLLEGHSLLKDAQMARPQANDILRYIRQWAACERPGHLPDRDHLTRLSESDADPSGELLQHLP
jgi:hypothetical protein